MKIYRRLAVMELVIPPLRERVADIPLLAAQMVRRASVAMERTVWCGQHPRTGDVMRAVERVARPG